MSYKCNELLVMEINVKHYLKFTIVIKFPIDRAYVIHSNYIIL